MSVIKSQIDITSQSFQENLKANLALLEELNQKLKQALTPPEKAAAKFRKAGKLLTRERVNLLLDPKSPFLEFSPLAATGMYDDEYPGASCVTGIGVVAGVACMILSSDPLIKGGASNPMTVQKYLRAQEYAFENNLPCIHLVESAGANLMYAGEVFVPGGEIFYNITRASAHKQPQIAVVFGSSTAGGAYIPALCDQIVMVKDKAMIYLGGPPLVKMATGEDATDEELGGALMHNQVSGVADYLAADDTEAIAIAREIVSHLNTKFFLTGCDAGEIKKPLYSADEILGIVSPDPRHPYDIREILARIIDGSELDEFKPLYGTTLITGFARVNGFHVGIIANNGILFSESSLKGCHFIELCEQRRIPIIYFSNISGFMVGKKYEQGGIVKHGADMINAVTNATVPQITIINGGAHGAGYYAMCGRPFHPRYVASWPCSKTSVMGPEQAAGVMAQIQKTKLEKEGITMSAEDEETLKAPIRAMFAEQGSPYFATARLYDDGIIDPRATREVLTIVLATTIPTMKKERGNFGVFRM